MSKFKIAKDGVDPSVVPYKILRSGAKIPAIGLGTFGSDRFSADDIAKAVCEAISVGYRHIDCALVYENEKEIGASLKKAIDGGIKREDLWITSKVWNNMHGDGDVIKSCKQSLKDLQLDYLDLYLIHWPFPNFHPPGCDITSRSPESKAYIHENYMKTWHQMEQLVAMGLVKHIGTSNMTIPKMKLLLRDAKVLPDVNEMELHPHFQQQEFYDFCVKNGVQPIGFSPIGSPTRPDRDKTAQDTVDIQDPVIVKAAKRLGVHPAVVCIKWAVQRGQVPIPFSIHRNEFLSNLKCTTQNPLTNEEMDAISKIDKNCRLIKGHVFLWKDDQTWEDLWDLNGEITPA